MSALLEVRELRTSFRTDDGIVKAVDGVSFSVEKGKTLGIVGESGCGKSVTCLSIMGLNNPSNTVTTGAALFNGDDLLQMTPRRLRDRTEERLRQVSEGGRLAQWLGDTPPA